MNGFFYYSLTGGTAEKGELYQYMSSGRMKKKWKILLPIVILLVAARIPLPFFL